MNLSDNQVKELANSLSKILINFYNDPKNKKECQKWLKKQRKSKR